MKMQIIVKIEQEDGSALTDPTAVEVNIPEIEAFDSPEVFDGCERGVLEARNGVVEEAMGKYLSIVAKKT
jgi:hypothetical protein